MVWFGSSVITETNSSTARPKSSGNEILFVSTNILAHFGCFLLKCLTMDVFFRFFKYFVTDLTKVTFPKYFSTI